jgi:predicted DCC family thiol-disulfide oxidoreductase YuxK
VSEVPDNLVLFDGVCNLCNSTIQFVIRHDRRGVFKFTPIQSEIGRRIYHRYGLDPDRPESILLVTPNGILAKSDAALAIAHQFGGLWRGLSIFKIIPRGCRDCVYSFIARHRYRWFGKRESCMVPTEDLKKRFLP